MADPKTNLPFTHEVSLTLRSNGDGDDVQVFITWDPDMEGQDYVELGYQPACHVFVQNHVMPMLEQVWLESTHPELLEPPTGRPN